MFWKCENKPPKMHPVKKKEKETTNNGTRVGLCADSKMRNAMFVALLICISLANSKCAVIFRE